ncbi:MAG: YgiQ family radical SAM protein [Deltaproteobacteria bacterium]|nr:YgiQ family radical SAM protein [Deltaproteobacteria bacterium]MBN2674431.1 YgiQ family radical SAM protein [Deltaproteobacteria bacterium]
MKQRGWSSLDILLISGDDYFDSPTHGIALIGRVLESAGYRVGIIARPDWKNPSSLLRLGVPNLFVGISAGAVDSTLNNYTADLAPRKEDAYAAKGSNPRPNFATAVYCGAAKSAFSNTPIVLGGVEASTRRFAYFDYLGKKIRRSVLVDTRADILVHGNGELTALEIARRLSQNKTLEDIPGTALLSKDKPNGELCELPGFDEIQSDPSLLIRQTSLLERNLGPFKQTTFIQRYQEGYVITHSPSVQTSDQLDRFHELPFLRTPHPSYQNDIPASVPVRWSVIAQRGCPGGCSFCALAYHQGRRVISRSENSILKEIEQLTRQPDFNGTITDIGGPTANAYGIEYRDRNRCENCKRTSCFFPSICDNLKPDQNRYLQLLKTAKALPGIKHLFVASGIRHDLALKNRRFIESIAQEFTGGHLKVAPEHTSPLVLKRMRKPGIESFEQFEELFLNAGRKVRKEQYVVPYFISGFPGCTEKAANDSSRWLQKRNQRLQQVQNFIPLPGTMAAAMYASELDEAGEPLYIPTPKERRRQKELLLGKVKNRKPNRHGRRRT